MELTVNEQSVYCYTGTKPIQRDRRTIVFLHGAGFDHSVWILQSRYFAYHGFNVLAVDLPGHGRSKGSPLRSIKRMAEWVSDLLDAAEIEQAAIVGHSMGALIALHTAGYFADRCTALALLGIACPMQVSDDLLSAARKNSPAAVDMISVWAHSPATHIGGNPSPGVWMVGSGKRLLQKAGKSVLYKDLNACNKYSNGLKAAEQVQCPTLIISGQRDLMTPARNAKPVIDKLANVKIVSLQGCGHMMFYERPGQTLDALKEFIN